MKRIILPVAGILASCALAFAVGSLSTTDLHADATDIDNSSAAPKSALTDFDGEGTEASPYLIKSKDDLIRLSALSSTDNPADLAVYGGSMGTFEGVYFKMTADIDLDYSTDFKGIASTTNTTVASQIKFQGVFDGDGHTIRRMNLANVQWAVTPEDGDGIGELASTVARTPVGMFGTLGSGAVIKNINIAADCRIEGVKSVGAVVGNGGQSGATITNCRNYADVTGYDQYAGGIVGYQNGAAVSDCYNSGNVTAGLFYAGGISGMAMGTVDRCANTGDVKVTKLTTESKNVDPWLAGGITGRSTKALSNCVNYGNVSGMKNVGGITGQTSKPINNCVNVGMVSCPENSGQIAGDASSLGFGQGFGNCVYDAQISTLIGVGNGSASGTDGKETADLTGGKALSGFGTDLWQFGAGQYPALKAFADEDAVAKARRMVAVMASGETADNVMSDVTLAAAEGLVWSLNEGAIFTIEGNTLKAPAQKSESRDVLTATFGNLTKSISIQRTDELIAGPFEGEGTEESPYLIKTKDDLITLSKLTCAENSAELAKINTFAGKFFKMTNDIDLEYDEEFIGISVSSQFAYSPNVVFAGTFDGDGHSIKRMKMGGVVWTTKPEDSADGLGTVNTDASKRYFYRSFIGRLAGTVQNLSIAADCKIEGYSSLGGVVAVMNAGSLVYNCRNYADVMGWSTLVGGIAGDVNDGALISNCYNEGNVTTAIMVAGGIAGRLAGKIEQCANAGDVKALGLTSVVNSSVNYDMLQDVGGIVGNGTPTASSASIVHCLNTGAVEGYKNVGGLSGTDVAMKSCVNYGIVSAVSLNNSGTICGTNASKSKEDVYFDSQTSVTGGVANYNRVDGVYPTTTQLLVNGFAIIGLDTNIWQFDANMHPTIKAFANEPKLGDARRIIAYVADDCTVANVRTYIICYNIDGFKFSLKDGSKFKIYGYSVEAPKKYSFDDIADTLVITTPNMVRNIYIYKKSELTLSGEGTEASPYLIKGLSDWVTLANFSNNSDETFEGKFVKLQYNLNFNFQQMPTLWSKQGTPFQGTFEGNNRTIANVNTAEVAIESAGAFGYIGEKGVVRNLTVQGTANTGFDVIGGIAGTTAGTIDNCVNEMDLTSTGAVVGGIAGKALAGAKITNCINNADLEGKSSVAGIVAYAPQAGVTVDGCANLGDIEAVGSDAAGLSAMSAAKYSNCYNMGMVKAATRAAGLVATPVAGSTGFDHCYNGFAVVSGSDDANADKCGAIVAVDTENGEEWNSGNTASEVYYVSDFGRHEFDKTGTAITTAELAAKNLGTAWTSADDYSLPVLATIADNDAVKLYSAAIIVAAGDSYNNVTRDFYLGRPSGVDWLSDNDAVTISGSKATVAPNFTGDVTLTATSGKYDREIILTVDSTGGVNGVDADSEVVSEKFFTLSGMEVAKPEAADGEIYIVVRTFANGNTATSKFVNNK